VEDTSGFDGGDPDAALEYYLGGGGFRHYRKPPPEEDRVRVRLRVRPAS
jgi:hypothetical protein